MTIFDYAATYAIYVLSSAGAMFLVMWGYSLIIAAGKHP